MTMENLLLEEKIERVDMIIQEDTEMLEDNEETIATLIKHMTNCERLAVILGQIYEETISPIRAEEIALDLIEELKEENINLEKNLARLNEERHHYVTELNAFEDKFDWED